MEEIKVVWWAILLGGLVGSIGRMLFTQRIEFPYLGKEPLTQQIILVPGFVGDLLLGPIAALMVAGAAASSFEWQTAFNAPGFWGPFFSGAMVGLGGAQILQDRARQNLVELERQLVQAAEKRVQ